MAVKLTAEQFRIKHAARLKGSMQDMRAGIERVTEAPGKAAAASADKWHAKISELSTKDKWAKQVGKVTLSEWQEKMINKGLPRVAGGIDAAAAKVEEFAEQLIEHQNRLLIGLEGMPDLTLEDSINRATTWIRGMADFKRK